MTEKQHPNRASTLASRLSPLRSDCRFFLRLVAHLGRGRLGLTSSDPSHRAMALFRKRLLRAFLESLPATRILTNPASRDEGGLATSVPSDLDRRENIARGVGKQIAPVVLAAPDGLGSMLGKTTH